LNLLEQELSAEAVTAILTAKRQREFAAGGGIFQNLPKTRVSTN
jgi:hypothetical protein